MEFFSKNRPVMATVFYIVAMCLSQPQWLTAESQPNEPASYLRAFDRRFLSLLGDVEMKRVKVTPHFPEFTVFTFAPDNPIQDLATLRERVIDFRKAELENFPELNSWLEKARQQLPEQNPSLSEDAQQVLSESLETSFWPSAASLPTYNTIFSPHASDPRRLEYDREFLNAIGDLGKISDKPNELRRVYDKLTDTNLEDWQGSDATFHQYQLLLSLIVQHAMRIDHDTKKMAELFENIGESYQEGGDRRYSLASYGSKLKEDFQKTFGEEYTVDAVGLLKKDREAYGKHNETVGLLWQELTTDRNIGGTHVSGSRPSTTILKVTARKAPDIGPYHVSYSWDTFSVADAVFFPEKLLSPSTIKLHDGSEKSYDVQTSPPSRASWHLGLLNGDNDRSSRDVALLMTPQQFEVFLDSRNEANRQFERALPVFLALAPIPIAGAMYPFFESVRRGVHFGAAASGLAGGATQIHHYIKNGRLVKPTVEHLIQALSLSAQMGLGFGVAQYLKSFQIFQGEQRLVLKNAARGGLAFGSTGVGIALMQGHNPSDALAIGLEHAAFAAVAMAGLTQLGRYHTLHQIEGAQRLRNYAVFSIGLGASSSAARYQLHGELYDTLGYRLASLKEAMFDGALTGLAITPLLATFKPQMQTNQSPSPDPAGRRPTLVTGPLRNIIPMEHGPRITQGHSNSPLAPIVSIAGGGTLNHTASATPSAQAPTTVAQSRPQLITTTPLKPQVSTASSTSRPDLRVLPGGGGKPAAKPSGNRPVVPPQALDVGH